MNTRFRAGVGFELFPPEPAGVLEWLYRTGEALRERGRPGEALELLRSALVVRPHVADVHYSLGRALSDLQREEEAAEAYREAVRCDPVHIPARYNLAVLALLSGDRVTALAQHRVLVELDPPLADILKYYIQPES